MDIQSLQASYRSGTSSPSAVVRAIYSGIRNQGERPVWISVVAEDESLRRAAELEARTDAHSLPLYGVPFAVKDNYDVAGMETTAACPAFAFLAKETAAAVERLLDAGAILIGKTNMDQFATGLVGTRTPYGICSSVFDAEYLSGGSSSGSAVAVAKGLVSFSLGTDTAGSGRVPAAFNQLVGLKPTRGRVSTHGLLPACRTLDCVSVFAETCADAAQVFAVLDGSGGSGSDARDAYARKARPGEGAAPWAVSRFRFGVPSALEFFADDEAAKLYQQAVAQLKELGGEAVVFDYAPLRDAARLLYDGPWVAERLAAVESFAAAHPEAFEPTVGKIILGASRHSAVEGFKAAYRLQEIREQADAVLRTIDFLLLPTTPTIYTIADVLANPVQLNSNLGYYTNFVNLLDMAAVAVPAGLRPNGLPFGVSLIGPAFTDEGLLAVADRLHRRLARTLGGSQRELAETAPLRQAGEPKGCLLMAVVGAHLTGQPLNWQMTQRRARLVKTVRTHPDYKLYALPNTTPPKPGLVYAPGFVCKGIELEVWAMPEETVGSFLAGIPAPLGLGTVRLEDGTTVKGFLCEPAGIVGAEEITHLGGWRAYLATLAR